MEGKFSDESLQELKGKYDEEGQGQVFKFLEKLSTEEKEQLYNNLKGIDPSEINRIYKSIQDHNASDKEKIEPYNGETVIRYELKEEEQKKYFSIGLEMIANGKIGAVLMAGGQGTRLGFDHPKGMYDIKLPSGKTLFQLHAEKLVRLKQIANRSTGKTTACIPWYIQTSSATHTETVKFLKKNNYFGLDEDDVFCFQQGVLPALDLEGKILLSTSTSLAMSPDGNGGLYSAIKKSGALDDMIKRGVEYVQVYGVDNPLVKVADPTLIGCCADRKVQAANKSVLKDDPFEKVGVMALRGGKFGVVEYSELSEDMATQTDTSGRLVYAAGNIAQHVFSVQFLKEFACDAFLPFHVANKKIPVANDEGVQVMPNDINGIKMEMFVFDVFSFASEFLCFAVKREEEFTAIKQPDGPKGEKLVKDSPDTARLDYSNYHISLAKKAGLTEIVNAGVYNAFEISPLVTYEGEDLEELVLGKSFTAPYHVNGPPTFKKAKTSK